MAFEMMYQMTYQMMQIHERAIHHYGPVSRRPVSSIVKETTEGTLGTVK